MLNQSEEVAECHWAVFKGRSGTTWGIVTNINVIECLGGRVDLRVELMKQILPSGTVRERPEEA